MKQQILVQLNIVHYYRTVISNNYYTKEIIRLCQIMNRSEKFLYLSKIVYHSFPNH